jgi:predicted metal-dependent peptidase
MALHEDNMGVARLYTISRAPYFSEIVYGFIFTPLPGIGTMLVTPGMILGYDPEWAVRASIEELGADIFHECHHFCRRHFWRLGVAHPKLFNEAGDLAINPDLRKAGWRLAKEAIFPTDKKYNFKEGLTTEEYYDLLVQRHMQQQQEKTDKEQGSSGGGAGEELAGQEQQEQEGDPQEGDGKSRDGVGCGHCGGIAGNPSEIEQQLEATSDLQPRTETEIQAIELRAAKKIKEWLQKQQGRGEAPAFLSEFLEAVNEEPLVPWEEELAQITHDCVGLMQAGGDDYSLRRPSKRTYLRGLIRPGLIEHKPEVAFILDTSGSMGKEQLLDSVREAAGVMEALGIDEVWFCEADAGVSMNWQRIDLEFFKNLKIAGRGGTDFRPAIKSVEDLHPVPDLVFYFTDGDGTAPAEPPPFEIIWVIVPSHWNKVCAPWGHTVFVTNDREKRRQLEEAQKNTPSIVNSFQDDGFYDDADDIG